MESTGINSRGPASLVATVSCESKSMLTTVAAAGHRDHQTASSMRPFEVSRGQPRRPGSLVPLHIFSLSLPLAIWHPIQICFVSDRCGQKVSPAPRSHDILARFGRYCSGESRRPTCLVIIREGGGITRWRAGRHSPSAPNAHERNSGRRRPAPHFNLLLESAAIM
jgi:hypothetical protein